MFKLGSYITNVKGSKFPSTKTLRIKYLIGSNGAETTTAIGGGMTITNLDDYRYATPSEICEFLKMELKSYSKYC